MGGVRRSEERSEERNEEEREPTCTSGSKFMSSK